MGLEELIFSLRIHWILEIWLSQSSYKKSLFIVVLLKYVVELYLGGSMLILLILEIGTLEMPTSLFLLVLL